MEFFWILFHNFNGLGMHDVPGGSLVVISGLLNPDVCEFSCTQKGILKNYGNRNKDWKILFCNMRYSTYMVISRFHCQIVMAIDFWTCVKSLTFSPSFT